jgi:hypothetical protein
VEALIGDGHLVAAEEVKYELGKKDDSLYDWARKQSSFFVPLDEAIQKAAKEILRSHRMLLNTRQGKSGADVFVIAVAKVNDGCVVVTEESRVSVAKPRIPDVCDAMGIGSMRFLDLMRKEGWAFRS